MWAGGRSAFLLQQDPMGGERPERTAQQSRERGVAFAGSAVAQGQPLVGFRLHSPSPAPRHHKAHPLGSPTLMSAHRGRLHGPAVRSALQGPCKLQGHRLWALHLLMCPIWIPVLGPVFSFILEGHTESTPKQRGPLAGRMKPLALRRIGG